MTQMTALKVRVLRKTPEALDIVSFELVALDGEALPDFAAGAHIDVKTPAGQTRQYSLCNDPAEVHRYVIGVLRDPASRGGSKAMHEQVCEGDVLEISAPKNHFRLVPEASDSLLIAGGIGITPILCMAESLAKLGRPFRLHYCARSPERAAFCQRIAAASFAERVHFHFDDGDHHQRLPLAALMRARCSPGQHLYVCGPTSFIKYVLDAARLAGWPEEFLHVEFFRGAVEESESGESFEVVLASSGQVVEVLEGQTVVQALAAIGVNVPTSCEQGVCGTCVTGILDGVPDHKDMYLTGAEQAANKHFTPCCSRAKTSRLVLDL